MYLILSRIDLRLDRERLVETFAENLQNLSRVDLARPTNIQFIDEHGIDQGSVPLTPSLMTMKAD